MESAVTYTTLDSPLTLAGGPCHIACAIGRNPLSIIAPGHRVVCQTGSHTEFAGVLEWERWLLAHERALADYALLFPAA